MPMLEGMDFVQMRNGTFYVGDVTSRTIKVEVAGLEDELTVKLSKVAWIIFGNPYGDTLDRVQLVTGSELRGKVTTKKLTIKADDLGTIKPFTQDMLTVQMASNHDLDLGMPG